MDTLRGFGGTGEGWDLPDLESLDLTGLNLAIERNEPAETVAPPPAIGQHERRMQVRAYDMWADLIGDRLFPDIAALGPLDECEFADQSVVLDFSAGIDDPLIKHVGRQLTDDCGALGTRFIGQLSDIPSGSLLSRITEHYVQILARQAPIGFEAEFVNRQGKLMVYRGILLPFSRDNVNIDHIYGVLSWKELADTGLGDTLGDELVGAYRPRANAVRPSQDDLPAPLSKRLRAMSPRAFDTLDEDGPEFTLLMARRLTSGNVMLLGEVPFDESLVRRAAEKLTKD